MKMLRHGSLLAFAMPLLLPHSPVQAKDLPSSLTLLKRKEGAHSMLLDLRNVQPIAGGKLTGNLYCTFDNQTLPSHPHVTFTGTRTATDITSGKVMLDEALKLDSRAASSLSLEALNDCYLEKLAGNKVNLNGTLALKLLESSDASSVVNFKISNLGIGEGGISGRIEKTGLAQTLRIPKLSNVALKIRDVNLALEDNRITDVTMMMDVALPEPGGDTTASFPNVKFETHDGEGLILGTDEEFDLHFGSSRLKIQGGLLDLDTKRAGCPQPAYWNKPPVEWQGLYFKQASLVIPQLQEDAATLSATEIHLDDQGISGEVEWDTPKIKHDHFELTLKPGHLKWVRGECVQGEVEGDLKFDAHFFKEGAAWEAQPVELTWSIDIIEKQPNINFNTPGGKEIRLRRKGKETGMVLNIVSGEYAANTLSLKGTLAFSELAMAKNTVLKSAGFRFENLKIDASGKVSLGEMSNTDPLKLEAGPCLLTVTSLKMSQPNDATSWQIEMGGNAELTEDLPLKVKPVSANGKLSLTCGENGITMNWNDLALTVTANDILGVAATQGKLHLTMKDGEYCLLGNAGLNFDELSTSIDNNSAYNQGKILFLLAKDAWYIGGEYNPPNMESIALGKTGLRMYSFRGGMGKNVVLNSDGSLAVPDNAGDPDLSQIRLASGQTTPHLVADVIIGTDDKKTCWGRAKLTVQQQRTIQLKGQLHLSEDFSTTQLQALRSEESTPNSPHMTTVEILWDDVNKGFMIETNASMLLQWQSVSQLDMKTTGKVRLFMSSQERSLRIGSVDDLPDNGVIVTTPGGSKFKGAFYIKEKPVGGQWKIVQAQMGVLWNKEFPIYSGLDMNGEIEGALYYFANDDEMEAEWKEALNAVQEQWKSDSDLSQKAFIGRIRGKVKTSYSIVNAQIGGEAMLILTPRNLFVSGEANVSAGILGVNKTILKVGDKEEYTWKFNWRDEDGKRNSAFRFLTSGKKIKRSKEEMDENRQDPYLPIQAALHSTNAASSLLLLKSPLREQQEVFLNPPNQLPDTTSQNFGDLIENSKIRIELENAASGRPSLPWSSAEKNGGISVGLFAAQ